MEKLKENNFKRQEFKFTLDKKSFLSLAKDKKFRKIYPTRTVNSVYFDTINFNFFMTAKKELFQEKKLELGIMILIIIIYPLKINFHITIIDLNFQKN